MKTFLMSIGAGLALASAYATELPQLTPGARPLDDAFSLQPQGVVAYEEGKEHALPAPISLQDGTLLQPTGEVMRPDGAKFSLEPGQIIITHGAVQLL